MNIIWKKPDNTLAITSILDGSDPAEHAKVLQGRGDVPASWELLATSVTDFPTNWNRQEDFIYNPTMNRVEVDLDRAKESTKNRLREERAPLFSVQDVLFQRNIETGTDNAAVIAEKKRLRDLTTLPDSCTTLEALAALTATKP